MTLLEPMELDANALRSLACVLLKQHKCYAALCERVCSTLTLLPAV